MKRPTNAKEAREFNKQQEYVRDASPNRWIDYSGELQEAAAFLWEQREERLEVSLVHDESSHLPQKQFATPRAYALLAGFALENSLKAQLILEDPRLITSASLDNTLKSHRLSDLMRRVRSLTFTSNEFTIATILESAIPYWGRYPVPLNHKALQSDPSFRSGFHDDFATFNYRVRKHVYDRIKDGWDSGVGPKIVSLRSKEFGDNIAIDEPFPWCGQPMKRGDEKGGAKLLREFEPSSNKKKTR